VNQLLTLVVSGLSLGCIYALIALGFVVAFKATRVVNFTHGSLLLLGAYVVGRLHQNLGFLRAALVGVAVAAITGVLIESVIIRRVRHADLGSLAILTLGVDILLATELTRRIGTSVLTVGDPWGADVVRLGSIRLPQTRVAAAVTALVLIGAFLAAFKLSPWGIAMRAAAENAETAALMGIRLGRVATGAWALAERLPPPAGSSSPPSPLRGSAPASAWRPLAPPSPPPSSAGSTRPPGRWSAGWSWGSRRRSPPATRISSRSWAAGSATSCRTW
jgi:branched-chain amino acid transport system permease protein